jgi:hypothetical protein
LQNVLIDLYTASKIKRYPLLIAKQNLLPPVFLTTNAGSVAMGITGTRHLLALLPKWNALLYRFDLFDTLMSPCPEGYSGPSAPEPIRNSVVRIRRG